MSNVTHPPKSALSPRLPGKTRGSERILTELRTEGYDVVLGYDNADMVIEHLRVYRQRGSGTSKPLGEALTENGRSDCDRLHLGAKEDQIREVHPKVLEITGPQLRAGAGTCSSLRTKPKHNLFPEPGAGTGGEADAASSHLKISEGCNHRCTFTIIPSMRGDLRAAQLVKCWQKPNVWPMRA